MPKSAVDFARQEVYRQAESLRSRRKYQKALKLYLEIIENDPEDLQALSRLADLYVFTKQLPAAAKYLEKVAYLHVRADRLDKATAVYRQLLGVAPQTFELYHDFARILVARDRFADAAALYEAALPTFKGRRYSNEARKLREWILELNPQQHRVRLELARIFKKGGGKAGKIEALKLLRQGIKLCAATGNRQWRRRLQRQIFFWRPGWSNLVGWLRA